MFEHTWTINHYAKCPVTEARADLLRQLGNDPTNRYLLGALPEYDNGGDQEVELCECAGQWAPGVCEWCGEGSNTEQGEVTGGFHADCRKRNDEVEAGRAARTTTDARFVDLKSYPLTRTLTVDIYQTVEGDLKTDVPSIAVWEQGQLQLHMTWDEAREFAEAITHVTDVAEFG